MVRHQNVSQMQYAVSSMHSQTHIIHDDTCADVQMSNCS